MCFMALSHRVIDCCPKQGFESLIRWHHHHIRHIKGIHLKMTVKIKIIGKWAAPLILKEISVGMKSCHENRVFGVYANKMRIKQKTLWCSSLVPRILCKKYSSKWSFSYSNYSISQVTGIFCLIKKCSLFYSYKMTAGVKARAFSSSIIRVYGNCISTDSKSMFTVD